MHVECGLCGVIVLPWILANSYCIIIIMYNYTYSVGPGFSLLSPSTSSGDIIISNGIGSDEGPTSMCNCHRQVDQLTGI